MKRTIRLIVFLVSLVLLVGLVAFPACADQNDLIIINEPKAGDSIFAGSEYKIEWEVPPCLTIALAYSTDGGSTWNDITSMASAGGEGYYTWTVPDIIAPEVKIRITTTTLEGWPPVPKTSYNDSGVFSIGKFLLAEPIPIDPSVFIPLAPENLAAESVTSEKVKLTWEDKSVNETGFKLERATGGGSFSQVASLGEGIEKYTDESVQPGKTYSYRVRSYNAFGDSDYSNTLSVSTPAVVEEEEEAEEEETGAAETGTGSISMRFVINNKSYTLNGTTNYMDASPIIKEGRTLLPILYVADPLGAQVTWNSIEKKVTIFKTGKTIELWINNNTAKVNGASVMIDTGNPNVTPVIIPPGRTMLPLRFIADNLDCDVVWNAGDQSITVTYPK